MIDPHLASPGPPETVSDRDLLVAVAAGAMGLFDPFVDRYARRLHAFLFRQTGDRQRAEDLLQDVFVKAIRAARSGHGPRHPDATAWMFTLARHAVIDDRRARSARPLMLTGDAADLDERRHPPPDRALERADEQAVLERALQTLPDDQREAVLLRVYGELTYVQMSEVLAVAEGTLKSRVAAGLARLRDVLPDPKEGL